MKYPVWKCLQLAGISLILISVNLQKPVTSWSLQWLITEWTIKESGLGWWSRYSNSLRAGRFEDRIPVGERFSAHVQTGPGSHRASFTMGTGSFPGGERPGRDVHLPPPLSSKVKERVVPYLLSPSGLSWSVLGWTGELVNAAFTFYHRGIIDWELPFSGPLRSM